MVRRLFWIISLIVLLLVMLVHYLLVDIWLILDFSTLAVLVFLFGVGIYDIFQKKYNILRLYPVIGHLRYILLSVRPQIRAYYVESNQDGKPFGREDREAVYLRARRGNDTLPFGTQRDVDAPGFSSLHHSLAPVVTPQSEARVTVGNNQCQKPYSASRLNVSAMSFGAISKNAVLALNRGAKMGGFAHNTGEGGLSPYHLREGGDIIWQIGTGYFGCRTPDGKFDEALFKDKAQDDSVKMIEVKLSQGAKPSHGGVLLGVKVTPEIAKIRNVPQYQDCISPPAHTAFTTPKGLLEFCQKLRDMTGGKPVGFKLCIGERTEFLAICKAMVETGLYPDFVTVDGAEGGTGAAPLEFTDYIGVPLTDALSFVHSSLKGAGVREHVRVIASGKIITSFDMVRMFALGADMCNSARGMMFALGCVQSRRCHNDTCPTGVTTQRPERIYALNVNDKAPRVANFHAAMIKNMLNILGAAGIKRITDVSPRHVYYRTGVAEVKTYAELYPFMEHNQLYEGTIPEAFQHIWAKANAEHF